jgi:LytS/YehU family sensor histidine kinase
MLLIIILAITYTVYLIVKQIKKKSKLNETISRLKSQALINQLNPHLIFNILNSIQGIVSKGDIEKANIFISRFAKFMRQTLWANQNPLISLESELEITENYISLEKLRFPSEMTIEIVRNNYQKEKLVPSLLLQPFIENAIKHGIMPSLSNEGKISIIVSESELYLEIKIVDNGKGFGDEIMYGDGLKITEERLKLLNEMNTFQFERKGELTVVTIKIYS